MRPRHRPPGPCLAGRPYVDPGITGPLPEPEQAMFVFDAELAELERAFYRHLLGAIDLDALFRLEQILWAELQAKGRFTDDQVLDLSNAILGRAFERVAGDPRRSMKVGRIGPDGAIVDAPEAPHESCPFCRHGAGGRRRNGPEAGPPQEVLS